MNLDRWSDAVPGTLAIPPQKLGTKLVLIASAFLLVAMTAVGLTLLVSWDREGAPRP